MLGTLFCEAVYSFIVAPTNAFNQVAMKLGKRGDQVMLTKDKRPVDPTAMAAIYTNAKLVAKVVGSRL